MGTVTIRIEGGEPLTLDETEAEGLIEGLEAEGISYEVLSAPEPHHTSGGFMPEGWCDPDR